MINDLWYKNAIIYCVSVGAYLDSDGDGIGDFKGLLSRLDYLQGLGVTALWLMPFQPSPRRDDGYDVADYYGVDPRYGTLGDFVEFTHGCDQRGMRVLIDLVVNHTSNEHPWFQEARRDPDSAYRDWYVWSKKKPRSAARGVAFPGVQKSTWSYDGSPKAWYFHRFYDFQPDLNTENPALQAEILKIMGFWIQLGVCGFRMDAVPFVIAAKGPRAPQQPEEHYELLRTFREFISWRKGDAIVLAEANVLPESDMEYFGSNGERLQMMFNFEVNQNLFYALATADAGPLIEALKSTRPRPATAQWSQFLRNHDELDLGRLTDAQREAVFTEFAPQADMRLYGRGIRRRLAPMLQGDRRRLEMAYSLMMTLPGAPVIRYGDEIGMGDDLNLPERQSTRTAMQWSTESHGGFTKAAKPSIPVITGGPYGFEHVNVAQQRRDPDSLLNWTERIIRMRKEVPEIGWGDFAVLRTGAPQVLALRYDWRGNSVVAIHNLGALPREVRITPEPGHREGRQLVNLLSEDHSVAQRSGKHCIILEPYGYRWLSGRRSRLPHDPYRCLTELQLSPWSRALREDEVQQTADTSHSRNTPPLCYPTGREDMNTRLGLVVTAALLIFDVAPARATMFTESIFATGGAIGATSPDSVLSGAGSLWIAYQNGAASDGSSGSSTVVRYSFSGTVQHQWSIAGNVDGLRIDPTGTVWAMQNNDGNSTLTTINPSTNATAFYTYGSTYTNIANRGFDDAEFTKGMTFLSETNPASPTDPILLALTTPLASPLQIKGLLNAGTITDPDSLILMPNGDLALTGEADQTIVFIHNPGTASQTVSYLPLKGVGAGLPDDTIFPTATQGTFFYADTGANTVYKVTATGLPMDSSFIDVGNEFGSLDTSTGAVTPIYTGVSPHGAVFVPTIVPEPSLRWLVLTGLLLFGVILSYKRQLRTSKRS